MTGGPLHQVGRRTALTGALVTVAAVLALLASLTAGRWVFLVAGAVGGLVLVSRLLRPDLRAVRVALAGPTRVRVGEPLLAEVHLRHDGTRALPASRLEVAWPGTDAPVVVDVAPLPVGATATAQVRPVAVRRGVHPPATARLSAADPLGLRVSACDVVSARGLVVHPAPAAPVPVRLCPEPGELAGRASARGTGELAGLRPWRTGDQTRDVAWRASARRRALVVAERDEPERPSRWVVALVGTPRSADDEAALARAAATWLHLRERGTAVHVLAWPDGALRPGPAGPAEAVLDWCAALDRLAVPSAWQLREALPASTTELTVVPSSEVLAGWPADLQQHLLRDGVRVSGLDDLAGGR